MSGGIITGNDALWGDGVNNENGAFNMSGAALIDDDNDVYLPAGKYITISAALTGAVPAAKITPASYPSSSAITVLSGDSTLVSAAAPRFTVTPNSGVDVDYQVSSDGKIYIPATYYVSANGNDSSNGLTTGTPYRTIQQAISVANDPSRIYYIYVSGSITGGTGDSMAVIGSAKKIVLAGYESGGVLNAESARRVLTIEGSEEVTLGAGLTLTGGSITNANGAGVNITGNSKFRMSGGEISGNATNAQFGGAVSVSTGCSFIMTGGTIRANNATGEYAVGGVLMIDGGSFTLAGGTVYGSSAGGDSNIGTSTRSALYRGSSPCAAQYGNGTDIVSANNGTDATITWPLP
jgi:hypothetical protein